MKNLSTPARVYILGVIIAGGILAAILPQLPGAAPRLDLPFAVFVAAALLTQLVGVRVIMPGREGIAWSLINAVIVATVLLFPAGNSILLVLITFTAYGLDRKSTRLNSSHDQISYAVFCLKKKKSHRLDRPSTCTRT